MRKIILSISILGIFADSCAYAVPGRPIFYDRERETPAPTATQAEPQQAAVPVVKVEQSTQTVDVPVVVPGQPTKFEQLKNFFWEKPGLAFLTGMGVAGLGGVLTIISTFIYQGCGGNIKDLTTRRNLCRSIIWVFQKE